MLLIGSRAAQLQSISLGREARDFDFICTINEYEDAVIALRNDIVENYPLNGAHMYIRLKNNSIYEIEIAWPNTSAEDILTMHDRKECFPSIDILLMLKMSHRYLRNSPHFLKTMNDIKILKEYGATITSELKPILKKREAETYNYSHPKLNRNKKDFFDDSVEYVYDHDDIHLAMALGNKPAYMFFKDDDAEVLTDMKKFDVLSEAIKLNATLEESLVLAIERSLVPFPGVLTPEQAFLKALEKVCTSITSGKFREFSYDNYYKVVDLFRNNCSDYFDRFKIALSEGKIKEHKKGS